ncbi:hypothetical protein [Amphritea sp. HPY]|uniref:hypothetical protein n=1 Tax=Amphritea sp. HPY TaxID=3421652 RepID=UPI003D7C7EC5
MNEEPGPKIPEDLDECNEQYRFLWRRLGTLENLDLLSDRALRDILLRAEFLNNGILSYRLVDKNGSAEDIEGQESNEDSFQEELSALVRKELIERCIALREKTLQELEEFKPYREWWNIPVNRAKYELWSRMSYWSVEEGICLSLGLNPYTIKLENMEDEFGYGFSVPDQYMERFHVASRSIEVGELNEPHNQPKSFLKWLESKRFDYDEELKRFVEQASLPEINHKPEYLNPENARYSQELDLAIEAWEYFQDQKVIKKSPKQAIEKWLKDHPSKLSGEAIKRIATMINWKKRGGSPKSD